MSSTSKDKVAAEDTPPHGQILVYAAADGRLKIEVRLEDRERVTPMLSQIATLGLQIQNLRRTCDLRSDQITIA